MGNSIEEEEVASQDVDAKIAEAVRNIPKSSIEKIVAAVIMLVVVSACGWVGTTVAANTSTVVSLELQLKHLDTTVVELKTEVGKMRGDRSDISLIMERMRADDEREERDTNTIKELEKRLSILERDNGKS